MNLSKIHPLIWVVNNFIDLETRKVIVSETEALNHSVWMDAASTLPEDSYWVNRTISPDNFSVDCREYLNRLSDKVFSCFDNYKEAIQVGNLHRTLPDGRALDYHVDNYDGPDIDNIFGVVLYLNDNYTGGEIHYPDLDIEYKPKAGDLVVHYAGLLHGVKPVFGGTRYIFTSFVRGSEDTTFLGETVDLSTLE